jgi:hypothetical protein
MKINQVRTLGSKWIKTKVLLQNKQLRSLVPQTVMFNRTSLLTMLNKFKMVYIKPVHGSAGQGVMKVEKFSPTKYRYQVGATPRTFNSFEQLFNSITKSKLKRTYLVQQGIYLLKYKSNPFDVRIMVQKSPNRTWETTGYIGRVAHPKRVVTNFHNSGTPIALENLLHPYMQNEKKASLYLESK